MGRGRSGRGPRAQSGRRAVADAPPRKRGGELKGGEPELPSPPRGGRASGSSGKAGGGPELEPEPEPARGELVRAARAGEAGRVQAMLSGGADPDESEGGSSGETALVAAATGGDPEGAERRGATRFTSCVRALVKGGASVDRPDDSGRTPLLAAASSGRAACVKALLDLGADEDLAGADGETALGVAAALGHAPVLRLLLQKGADMERTGGADERTPLMAAAAGGHEACVRLLLAAGARAARKDVSGRTARDLAQGKHTVCECLLEPTTARQAVSRLSAAAAASKHGSRDIFSGLASLDLGGGAPPRGSPTRSGSSVGSTSPASATSGGSQWPPLGATPASAKPPRHPQRGPAGATHGRGR